MVHTYVRIYTFKNQILMQHQEVVHILMMLDVTLHKHASELTDDVITG